MKQMSSEQVFIPVSSTFPYQSLIQHCSTLTNHRAISLRRRHVDISSVSRKLHLGVVFGSVEVQLYFSSSDKVQVFGLSRVFFERYFRLFLVSHSEGWRDKGPQSPSARWAPQTHTHTLKFVEVI